MPEKVIYRKLLLQAVEAFLEKTLSAQMQAQEIIQHCYEAITREEKRETLDDIIWGFFIRALTDSVYYKSEKFLRETHELLLGQSSQPAAQTVFRNDYRTSFTGDEAEWYAQLISMTEFLSAIPYELIREAAFLARQKKESWEVMRTHIPEIAQAEKLDEEYQQRKSFIEAISAKSPLREDAGDEKIYHLILREITGILINIRVGKSAAFFGYPTFGGSYSSFRISTSSTSNHLDGTESILWAKRSLDVLAGKRDLFISWYLSKALTFDADVLLISLH